MRLGYSITLHRLQGLEPPRANIYFGPKEIFSSYSYVLLSRCQKLSNYCILDESLELERFKGSDFFRGLNLLLAELFRLRILRETTLNAEIETLEETSENKETKLNTIDTLVTQSNI